MRVVDYIANRLKKETDVVFGVTGGCIVNMVDAFYKAGIKIVPMHHEQAAAMAADAYSRVSGKLGVCFGTSGPGGQNLLTGLACSYYDSVPVLAITGQVPTTQRKTFGLRQKGFQESPNSITLDTVCKATYSSSYEDIVSDLEDAIIISKGKRYGPCAIDLHDDIQRKDFYEISTEKIEVVDKDEHVNFEQLNNIKKLMINAKKPVLILGAGCNEIRNSIDKIFEDINLPVLLTWGAIDLLDNGHMNNLRDFGVTSQVAGNLILNNSDLIISVGSRLDTHEYAGKNIDTIISKTINIDIDMFELEKCNYKEKVRLSAKTFFSLIDNWYQPKDYSKWLNACVTIKTMYPVDKWSNERGNPYYMIDIISRGAMKNAIVIGDAGQSVAWLFQTWKVKKGQRVFTSFNHSPMGYAIPAAIGAYFAAPDRPIYCFTGDGGLMMNVQELANIGGNKWPIGVYVLNNSGYGMIRQTLNDWETLDKNIATDYKTGLNFPIMRDLASAMHMKYVNVDNMSDYVFESGPVFYNCYIKPESKIEPKLKYGNELWNQCPYLSDEELENINEILSV